MTLFKKIAFYVFVGLALIFGVLAYLKLKNIKKPKEDALAFVPAGCLVYAKTNDLIELNKKINSQSLIVDQLIKLQGTESFFNSLQSFADLIENNERLKEEFENNPIHYALYSENFDWVLSFNIKELGDQQYISSLLKKLLNASRQENDTYIFEWKSLKKMYFRLTDGVVIVSPDLNKIQQAFNKSEPKLIDQMNFINYRTTLDEQQLFSLYLDHAIYASSKASSKINLNYFLKKGILIGNIDLQPSQMSLNGFLKPDSSEWLNAFLDQEAQEADFINLLPVNTNYFKAFGFSNWNKLSTDLNADNKKQNKQFWKMAEDTAMYEIEKDFYNNLTQVFFEFAVIGQTHVYSGCLVKDTAKALEHLHFISDSSFEKNGSAVFRLQPVKKNSDIKLFGPLLNSSSGFAFLKDSYLFFAEDQEDILYLNQKLYYDAVLTTNESFMQYREEQFPDNFQVLVYTSPTLIKSSIPKFLNFKSADEKMFDNFKHMSFAIVGAENDFKFRWHLMYEAESGKEGEQMLWSLDLDTISHMKPQRFVNHQSNENELLIQDEANALYLIGAKGNLIWKKKINEKVTSEMYTVDIFKNNKYQILFSTAHYLHLIDRKGNYVEGYPVKVPAEICSGLTVLDYDQTKDYRLFFACTNRKIYNYTIYGIKQEGFIPFKTEAVVRLPIQYAKVGSSDYIVALDEEGKIYTFSRKGEGRIGLTNRSITNCPAFYLDVTNSINTTYLVYVDDKNGWINKISFSDKKEIIQLRSEEEQNNIRFTLVDENRNMDLVLTSRTTISAYNLNGNRLFEKPNDKNYGLSDYYGDQSHSFYYALSVVNNELVILDQIQQKNSFFSASSMPLICDLFKDNKTYLIFSDKKHLNCLSY